MIIQNFEQGSPEWFQARLGLVTASNFERLITKAGKKRANREDFICEKIDEILEGEISSTFVSSAMKRGQNLEAEARMACELELGVKFKQVGFVKQSEDAGFGCSPDGLREEMGLEIKCPEGKNFVKYVRKGGVPNEYKAQVQGSMLVTGLKLWCFYVYHPTRGTYCHYEERDDEYIEALSEIINETVKQIRDGVQEMKRSEL